MKKAIAVIIAFVLGLACGFILCKKPEPEPEPTPLDPTIISEEVKDIAELATYENTYTISVPYEGEALKLWKKIKIPFTEKSMVVEYQAKVKLGLNLTDDNYDVKVANDTVTVTVPHSEILSHEIIEESWVLKDKDNGLFNPLTPEDDSKAREFGKKQALEKLDMDSLYKKADDNAKEQIEKFLGLTCPDATVVVEFE